MTPKTPVWVLSGFLGAGKTTLLSYWIQKLGKKIGIVVNDLAEVNIDFQLIQNVDKNISIIDTSDIKGGCVCCNSSDSLILSIEKLFDSKSEKNAFDFIIVELSGASEPKNVLKFFERLPNSIEEKVYFHSLITVIDCGSFLNWIEFGDFKSRISNSNGETSHKHTFETPTSSNTLDPTQSPSDDDGRVDSEFQVFKLLVQQIELANVIVLNKCDQTSSSNITKCQNLIKTMNENAKIHTCSFGVISPDKILHQKVKDGRHEANSVNLHPSCAPSSDLNHSHSHSHSHHDPLSSPTNQDPHQSSNISSFVFSEKRPFHPERLQNLFRKIRSDLKVQFQTLDRSQSQPSTTGRNLNCLVHGVLRAKGFVWISSHMNKAMEWSQAGRFLELQKGNSWDNIILDKDLDELHTKVDNICDEIVNGSFFKDRKQQIVFIGTQAMNKDVIISTLNDCLLTEVELNQGPIHWKTFRDSLAITVSTASRAKAFEKPTFHGKTCSCCNYELKLLDQMGSGGF